MDEYIEREVAVKAFNNFDAGRAEITLEGLRKLNTLIWKYTTVHDGGAV